MSRSRRTLAISLGLIALGVLGLALIGYPVSPRRGAWTGPTRTYTSNGERIFFTGTGSNGKPIPFEGGPFWLGMHGGGCASCHGSDGRGGRPVMMLSIIPPDIRYSSLTVGHDEHGIYNDELIVRAVTQGLDAEGNSLDPAMPRYRMSSAGLTDLLAYLKTQD